MSGVAADVIGSFTVNLQLPAPPSPRSTLRIILP